ncbi:MAG: flagellar motor protein MotB [Proteobacteria bacterium]|nr:flagellar motor protein MotB [Pseudomonadota bacterium]
MAEQVQPIIIKKGKKGKHRHHGGAWKVAYADFVTAMMAFFLLLWLLNAVTQDQLEGIANYFAPISLSRDTSGAGDILGGATILEEGAMKNVTARASVSIDLPPPKAGDAGGEETVEETAEESSGAGQDQETAESKARKLAERQEEEQFEKAEKELRETIQGIPSLERLADSLLVENTPEGLRIQIVDQEGLAMFPKSSANMYAHTRKILELVAKVVAKMPQKLKISGHTDALRYISRNGYSNWELSADRANASRRALLEFGVPFERVSRVVGMAATEPLVPDNPIHPSNRRISIVLLRGTGEAKPAAAEKTPPEAAEKPAEAEESLPGLEEIRRQQLLDGSPHPMPAEAKKEAAEAKKEAAEAKRKAAIATEKPAEAEESLPGLEEIRRQQLLDGSPHPMPADAKKDAAEAKKKAAEAKRKAAEATKEAAEAKREAAIAEEKPIETGDLLPGLEAIRSKQLRGEWEPKKPGAPNDKPAAAAMQPAKEQKEPAPAADEPVETKQLLPGLEQIRRKQLLEESRSGLTTQSGETPEDSTVLFPRLEEIRRRRRFE